MKRKLLALMCVTVISAGMLAGCGNDSSTTTTEDSKDAAKEETTEESTEETAKEEGQEAATTAETAEAVSEEEAEAAGFSDGTEDAAEEEDTEKETADADAAESKDATNKTDTASDSTEATVLNTDEPLTGIHHAEIEVKDYGTIELELDADTAPISVTNFVKLAQENFYDGLTFHRIMDGFMIQGGDPNGDGTGGSDENIKGEFTNNGVTNDISHTRGTISMARASDPDSGSSQFFIVQTDSTFLDGDYAGFGHVTAGMDIVDQICKDVTPTDDNGTVKTEEQPVITSIKIVD